MKSKKMSYFLFVLTAIASFLFFTIQLTSSKIITPVFGGIAWVWILTMLFYQAVLLTGYYLAGVLKNKLTKHVLMGLGIFLAMTTFIIPSPDQWGSSLETFGMLQVLYTLAFSIGLTGIALSSSTVILQKAAHSADISPWQLYFYSNIGSLSAIFLYPFVIENLFPMTVFMSMWKTLLFASGISIIFLALLTDRKYIFSKQSKNDTEIKGFHKSEIISWLIFSALPSAFLAVSTAFLTEDIASMPFLWAMPLGVFMLAFALPFAPKSISAYRFGFVYILVTIVLLYMGYIFIAPAKDIIKSITVSLIAVFLVTWVCVSALVRNKPAPDYLQRFYVALAVGGFIGNFFVSVLSPAIFNTYIERWIITTAVLIFPAVLILSGNSRYWMFEKNNIFRISTGLSLIIIISFSGWMYSMKDDFTYTRGDIIDRTRSMYGPLTVENDKMYSQNARMLYNGNTEHGYQVINDDGTLNTDEPTAYYNLDTALDYFSMHFAEEGRKGKPNKAAVIGLGIGTMNYYSYPGLITTFFEIDKNVVEMAKKHFTYLDINKDNYNIEIGDGRLMIGKKPDNTYSLILVDAFTGVSIPRHLLTSEAIKLYSDKLTDNGIIMIHTSNRYLYVEKIVNLSVHKNGLYCYLDDNYDSVWVVASKKPLNKLKEIGIEDYPEIESLKEKTWTDEFTPLF